MAEHDTCGPSLARLSLTVRDDQGVHTIVALDAPDAEIAAVVREMAGTCDQAWITPNDRARRLLERRLAIGPALAQHGGDHAD